MTYDELKRRDAKIFKRWYDDPASVCPPEGEDLVGAAERLGESLAEVIRKQGDRTVGVVLGPTAFAVMRCRIEAVELAKMRSMMHDQPLRYKVSVGGKTAKLAPNADPVTLRTTSETG